MISLGLFDGEGFKAGERKEGHEQGKVIASFHKWSFLNPAPYTQGSFTLFMVECLGE
jgi:hypothetical protein